MKDSSKTNQELIAEISVLKKRIQELEQSEAERKRAEEALRESEIKLQAIFDTVVTGILIIDKDTQIIIEANKTAMEMTGLPKERIIGQICHLLVCPAEAGKCPVKDLGQSVDCSERKLIHAEGHLKDILKTVYPITIKGRDCYVESFIDISARKQAEEALRGSEERYRALVENASDIVFRLDDTGHITYVNPAALRIMRYEEKEIIGRHYPTFIRPDMQEEAMKFFGRQFVKGIPNTYSEYPVIVKDGHELWLGQNTQLIFQDGKVIGFQAVARDITDRKQAEGALRQSEERYRTILENIEDGYFEVDITGNFTFFNDSVCRIIGYTRTELMGMNNRQYMDKENSRILYQAFNKVFRTGEPSKGVDYEIIGKHGIKLYVESSTSLMRNISGQPIGFRGIMRNITERKRMEEALLKSERRYRELSIVDDLTQLYNSRHFYFQLKIELDRSNRYEQPLTLLLLDLDNFKAFNDAYGHVEGDQVLMRLGQVVKRCLRETDFAFRYGGEEFTVILPMTTSADGAVTAERIRTEFKKETFSPAPGQDVHVTVSIGLAQYKPQEEMKAFVHRVDQLMYQGKKNGKNRVCSDS